MRTIENSLFLVVDTETTDKEAEKARVVEIAAVATTMREEIWHASALVNPGVHIPPTASAIHHLVDADVADAPSLTDVLRGWTTDLTKLDGFAAYVAHNAPYDSALLPMLTKSRWLDTLRLARRLRPNLESHANEVLRYSEGLHGPRIDDSLPHRAEHDTAVTAAMLRLFLGEIHGSSLWPQEVDQLIDFIETPMVMSGAISFGKHKGTPWPEVPRDYLTWLLRQTDTDKDVKATAQHYVHNGRL